MLGKTEDSSTVDRNRGMQDRYLEEQPPDRSPEDYQGAHIILWAAQDQAEGTPVTQSTFQDFDYSFELGLPKRRTWSI
jgi:hypothetical protein